MADYVTLLGSEQVLNAGYAMKSAASDMDRAAGNLEDSLRRHRMFMDDWLERFEAALNASRQTEEG
jgi:hypothetical protein